MERVAQAGTAGCGLLEVQSMLQRKWPQNQPPFGTIRMTTAPTMPRSATALTDRPEWRALETHASDMRSVHLRA